MYFDCCFTAHAKWILAGEHAVLRGYPALVFPLKQKKLTLQYHALEKTLSFELHWPSPVDIQEMCYKVLAKACELLAYPLTRLTGHFHLTSNITIGAGMGASAALCVVLAKWFVHQRLLSAEKSHEFAKRLEHLFHGQSSGLDIAGVAASQGVYFKQGNLYPLVQSWQPCWYLSFSNQKSVTLDCVQKVRDLQQKDSKVAALIDTQMHQAVVQAQTALEQPYHPKSLEILAQAIDLANRCFIDWNLISNCLYHHQQTLRLAGALATKPTGSGMGGYVLSLWQAPPESTKGLISLN